jgi:hypothetical protein
MLLRYVYKKSLLGILWCTLICPGLRNNFEKIITTPRHLKLIICADGKQVRMDIHAYLFLAYSPANKT